MAKKDDKKTVCCPEHKDFGLFAIIIFVMSILWILQEVGTFNWDVPWLPIVVAVAALGKFLVLGKKK